MRIGWRRPLRVRIPQGHRGRRHPDAVVGESRKECGPHVSVVSMTGERALGGDERIVIGGALRCERAARSDQRQRDGQWKASHLNQVFE